MTDSAIRLKAKQMAEWVADVRCALAGKFEEYLRKNGEVPTKAKMTRLVEATRAQLMTNATFNLMCEAYFAGQKPEEFAEYVFLHYPQNVYRASGLQAMFKRARQRSAAAYACSPESEAYWAS